MLTLKNIRLYLVTALLVLLTSCVSKALMEPTLFDRLGGKAGVTSIVDNLLFELGDNQKLIEFFENTDIVRFRNKLIEQLCEVSDGDCIYTGDSMAQSHSTMTLNRSHFDSLVNDLKSAMAQVGTPIGAQNDLLSRLVPMYDEVMNPKKYLPTETEN